MAIKLIAIDFMILKHMFPISLAIYAKIHAWNFNGLYLCGTIKDVNLLFFILYVNAYSGYNTIISIQEIVSF